jgi:hypothetical protein
MGGEHIFTASITTYINNLILTTMNSLFKQENPRHAQRVCRVENLNSSKGITAAYRVSKDQRKHTVVLCLANKTVKTTFPSELGALLQLEKYKELYKEKKA